MVYGYLYTLIYLQVDKIPYYAQFRLLNITLAFFKFLFYIRIFEEYGFLVQMVVRCVQDLVPFIVAYVIFLILFSIIYSVVKLDLDPEISDNAK